MIRDYNVAGQLCTSEDIFANGRSQFDGTITVPYFRLASSLAFGPKGLCAGGTSLLNLDASRVALASLQIGDGPRVDGIGAQDAAQLVRAESIAAWCDQIQSSAPFSAESITLRALSVTAPITCDICMEPASLLDDSLQELVGDTLPPMAESPPGRAIIVHVDPCAARTIRAPAPDTAVYRPDCTALFISNGEKWFAMNELGCAILPI